MIEVDDAYIGASKTGKTGRGGGHTVRVDIEHHVGKPGLLAIGSVPSLAKPHLIDFAKRRLQPGRLPTPMPSSPSHVRPSAKITPSEEADQRLPWVHLVISNLKRFLLGTYQGAVRPHRLQEYLDESGYRFNRRFWEAQIPNRLLSLSVDHLPVALRGT